MRRVLLVLELAPQVPRLSVDPAEVVPQAGRLRVLFAQVRARERQRRLARVLGCCVLRELAVDRRDVSLRADGLLVRVSQQVAAQRARAAQHLHGLVQPARPREHQPVVVQHVGGEKVVHPGALQPGVRIA
jgi:hypothetical protein